MNRFRILAAWLCLAIPLAAVASSAEDAPAFFPMELDLAAARELCLLHNPRLHQIRAQVDQQEGAITELRAARRPALDLGSTYTTFEERRQQSFGSTFEPDTFHWGADLEASITVYSGGRSTRSVESRQATRRAVQADLAAASQDLLNQVFSTYFDARLAQETAEVQRDAIRVLDEQLRYASSRADAGVVDRFEVMQAEVSLANARPPLVRAENDYRRAIEALRLLVGLPLPPGRDSMDVRLLEPELPPWEELSFDEALQRAARHRPELRALQERRDAQYKQLEIAERGLTPVVSLFAAYGVETDQFGDEDYLRGWTAGAMATWPLIDGGAMRGKTQQQSAILLQLEHQRAELDLAIGNEVRQALYDYQEATLILETADQVITQAEEALRLSRNRYQAGRGTQLDVLESQLQLTRARLEQATAHNTLQRAQVDLLRATGEAL